MSDGLKFVQCHDDYFREQSQIDEQHVFSWILNDKKCFEGYSGKVQNFFENLQQKMKIWNEKLANIKNTMEELVMKSRNVGFCF